MHRDVESSLEETVLILKRAKELSLLKENEIRAILKRRRDLEYGIMRTEGYERKRKKYLEYIVFEKELTKVLQNRLSKHKKNLQKKQKWKQAHVIVGRCESRIHLIYSRALRSRYAGDNQLWLNYIQYCIDNDMHNIVQRVFVKALAVLGHDYKIWLKCIVFHFDTCNDTKSARAISQRALRMLPHCLQLWLAYFKMELYYMIRLTTRRFAMGLSPEDEKEDDKMETDDGKLTFWTGAIPFTVLKTACQKLEKERPFSQLNCIQFYEIASECPLVPSALLESIVHLFNELYPDGAIVRLLNERVKWECEKVEYDRVHAKHKRSKKGEGMEKLKLQRGSLVKDGKKVLENLSEKVTEDSYPYEEKDKESLQLFFTNTKKVFVALSASFESVLSQLETAIQQRTSSASAEPSVNRPITEWDSKTLHAYLKSGYDDFSISSSDLSDCVKRLCLKPFRSVDEDDPVLCTYVLERDLEAIELENIYKFLISNPPVTLNSLIALIKAMTKRLRQSTSGDENVSRERISKDKWIQFIRKMFVKCTSMPSVREDVSFWIMYLEFERDIVKDAKQAHLINSKATRSLDETYRSHFAERLSLSNLSMQ